MKIITIVLLSLLFNFSCSHSSKKSSGAEQIANYHDGHKNWIISLEKEKGLDTLVFTEVNTNKKFRFQTDSVAHSFEDLTSLTFSRQGPMYFVTVWKKGAHGETLRVFSTQASSSSDLEVFKAHSAWPIDYRFNNRKAQLEVFIIEGAEQNDKNKKMRTFKP